MAFHQNLRIARLEKGLTQPVLAERAQIEQSYLSKLENGRSMPSDEVLARLAEALATTPEELMRNGEVAQPVWRRWLWPGIAVAAFGLGIAVGSLLGSARVVGTAAALDTEGLSITEQVHALAPADVKVDKLMLGRDEKLIMMQGRMLGRDGVRAYLATLRNAGLGVAMLLEFSDDDTKFTAHLERDGDIESGTAPGGG